MKHRGCLGIAAVALATGLSCSSSKDRGGNKGGDPAPRAAPVPSGDAAVPAAPTAGREPAAAADPAAAKVAAGGTLQPGCFAWSQSLGAWACVVGEWGRDGSERERSWSVTFPGSQLPAIEVGTEGPPDDFNWDSDDPAVLTPQLATTVNAALAEHGFVPKKPDGRKLEPGKTIDWQDPALAVRWKRVVKRKKDGIDGDFDKYDDRLQARCGGKDRPFSDVWTSNSGTPTVTITANPGSDGVLIEWTGGWGMEGAIHNLVGAQVFSLKTCTP